MTGGDEDVADEFVPAHGPGVGEMMDSAATVRGEAAQRGRQVSRERRAAALVVDERELPGHERTMIPDEELWEVNLVARDGSCYEVESRLLKAAPG